MEKELKERIDWVDCWKGIGIFLVVLGHTFVTFRDNIYIFHMPMFFFISGSLCINGKEHFGIFFKKKLRTLLFPYVLFMILGWCFNILVKGYYYEMDIFMQELLNAKRGINYINPTLWFLPALFLVEVIYRSIIWMGKFKFTLILVFFYLGNYFIESGQAFPWSLEYVLAYLLFYYLGNTFFNVYSNKNHHNFAMGGGKLVFIFTGWLCIIGFTGYTQMMNDISSWIIRSIIQNGIAILLIIVCLETSKLINQSKNLQLWGKNSLLIMAVHIYFLDGLVYFTSSALNIQINQMQNIYAIIATIVSLAIMKKFIMLYNEMNEKIKSFVCCPKRKEEEH